MKKLILPRRRFLLGSTAAALLAAAPWGARGQSTLNSVVMVGIPQAAGGTVWTVYLPGGAILNTGASTTDGLQEAVDAAFLAASTEAAPGYPLYVLGGEETTGGASVCALQTPVQFPPMQGGYVGLRNVSLANAGAMSLGTPMVRFDSMIYTRIELFGSQVAAGPHAANLAAVKFLPTNPLPQDKAAGITCGDSSFHASNCNSMMVDFSNGGSMTNFAFDIDELNGGSSNLAFHVGSVSSGSNFSGCRVAVRHLHGFAQTGIQEGDGPPAPGQSFGPTEWDISGVNSDGLGGTRGFDSWATADHGSIGIVDAALTAPFVFESGSSGALLDCPRCAVPIQNRLDNGSNNVIRTATGMMTTSGWVPYPT